MPQTDIDLTGQVAIVTGGGRGLGRAMAQALAEAHAAVAVIARTSDELNETVDLNTQAGGQATALTADVTDWDAVQRVVQTVEQQLGAVSLLVNNAGIICRPGPVWEVEPDHWRQVMDVNLNGAFLCTKAVLHYMLPRQRGRIINVASGAAYSCLNNAQVYCISKAAVVRLAECTALDASEHNIQAFAIDPGTVRTAMTEYLLNSDEGKKYVPEFREWVLGGGDVSADLSARLVTILASGKADKLTGRFISVHDDLQKMIEHAEQIEQQDLYKLRLRTLTVE